VQASSELLRKRTAEHVGQLTGQLNAATVALENLTEDAAALKAEKEALEATHATVVRVSPPRACVVVFVFACAAAGPAAGARKASRSACTRRSVTVTSGRLEEAEGSSAGGVVG